MCSRVYGREVCKTRRRAFVFERDQVVQDLRKTFLVTSLFLRFVFVLLGPFYLPFGSLLEVSLS